MDSQLTAARQGQTALQKPLPQSELKFWEITGLLGVLAEARQSTIGKPALKVFSSRLMAYDLVDIHAAVNRLSVTRRAEGETAFPDLATLDEAVQAEAKKRRIAEYSREKREREREEERHRREHPEEYVHMGHIFDDLAKKKGMDL